MNTIASTANSPRAVAQALRTKKFMVMSSKGHAKKDVFLVYTSETRKTKVCELVSKQCPMKEIKLFAGIPFVDESTAHQPGWFSIKRGESTYQAAKRFNDEHAHVQIKEIWRRVDDTDFTVSYV
jgi:hypothetical protein